MKELVLKSKNGTPITTSLLVAEKFEKRHADVLRAIENLNCSNDFRQRNYAFVENQILGSHKEKICFMNKDGFSFLAMGFTGERAGRFKEEYINAFNQMEQIIMYGGFKIPKTYREALLLAAEREGIIEEQRILLSEQEPKVRFAEAVTGSDTNILMRDLAKLICQTGVNIGEGRLYDWMVEWKYLIRTKRWSHKKQRYDNDYTPTQKAADLKVFYMVENVITVGDSSFIKHTIKITPKGQEYFINKFLKQVSV